jgi:hypothetical protein
VLNDPSGNNLWFHTPHIRINLWITRIILIRKNHPERWSCFLMCRLNRLCHSPPLRGTSSDFQSVDSQKDFHLLAQAFHLHCRNEPCLISCSLGLHAVSVHELPCMYNVCTLPFMCYRPCS